MSRAKRLSVVFALVALLSLTGAECVFVTNSGTFRDKEEEEHRAEVATAFEEGRFVDAPVQGVGYASGAIQGITGVNGEFQYESGQPVRFFIGDIVLGEAARGAAVLSPLDLVPGGDIDTRAVINIARLLQSLDALRGDGRITVPDTVRGSARRSNDALFAAIESLDFHDDQAFANAASQIVAVLTASYPFTATLVDSETARRHLAESLRGLRTDKALGASVDSGPESRPLIR